MDFSEQSLKKKTGVLIALQCSPMLCFFSASTVSGTIQQNKVHTPSTDCTDRLYQERGNAHIDKSPAADRD